MKNYTVIIPARAGSKGVPHKNIRECGGVPLIAHTIKQAIDCFPKENIFVSTDGEEIAKIAKKFGAQVPFLRKQENSTDTSSMLDVVREFSERAKIELKKEMQNIILLQPTSPLRKVSTIKSAIDLFEEKNPDAVVSIIKVPHRFSPMSLMKMTDDGELQSFDGNDIGKTILRRQDKQIFYGRNGPSVLIFKTKNLSEDSLYGKRVYGIECDEKESIDIDSQLDFELADYLLRQRNFLNENCSN